MTESETSFEASLARLEEIVERLQRDDVPLEEAVALFNEGTQIATHCDEMLTGAELQTQQLMRTVQERFASYDVGSVESDEESDDL